PGASPGPENTKPGPLLGVLQTMNPQRVLRLSLLSIGLAIPAAASLAQDSASQPPPPAPAAPETAPAEGTQPPPRRREGFVLEDLTQKLNLTADQQKSIGDAIKSSREQMKALRDDESLSDDDKRAKRRELMGTTRAQIRALL